MSTTKNLFNSALARTGMTVISAAVAFFFLPFLVTHLGERWYGIWVLISALVANSYLLDIGMATAVMRYVARDLAAGDHESANRIISTCLVLYTGLAVIVFVAAIVIGAFASHFVSDPRDIQIVRATIILVGLQYASEFPFKAFAGIVSSYVRYDLLMASRLLNLLLSTGLNVFFLRRGHGILTMAVVGVLVDQVTNFLYYRIAKHLFRDLKVGRRYVTRSLIPELFGYSTWSFLVQVANQLRFRTDSFIVGAMIGASSVTHYAIGLRLVEYLVDFVNRATNMLTPVFTRYFHERNYEEIRSKFLFVTRINAVLAIFGGGMLIVLGKAFVVRWMGPSFESSYIVLIVLTAALVVDLIGIHADNVLYAISQQRFLALVNLIDAGINLALSITLAHWFGIAGVALGTAIPLIFFRIVVIPRFVCRQIQLGLWAYYRELLPIAAYTLGYLAVVWLVSQRFLAEPSYGAIVTIGLASIPLYVLTIPFVGFSSSERLQLQSALPQRLQRLTVFLLGR